MTTSPIHALQISIYNTKHTQNTKIHFNKSKKIENPYFSKTNQNDLYLGDVQRRKGTI